MLMSLVILVTSQTERTIYAQNHNRPSKDIVSVENRDVEAIISQILSCPAWDELEKGDVKTKDKIMKSLVLISENDITMIRAAVVLSCSKYPQSTSLWSRIFLLNRYLFQVPEKSPVDGKLFGGWAGTPIENGVVNRLWPFSYNSQNELQLTGDFEGYYGNGYKGVEEFDYFQKTFGLRKK